MSENYDSFIKLLTDARVFPALKEKIAVFSIAWNNFEADFFNNRFKPSLIKPNIIRNIKLNDDEKNKINELYDRLLKYFDSREIERTVDSIWKAYRFESGLDNRTPEFENNVEFLKKKIDKLLNANEETDKLHFLLLIAFRVRNNLFHGLKSIHELNQNEELLNIMIEIIVLLFSNRGFI